MPATENSIIGIFSRCSPESARNMALLRI